MDIRARWAATKEVLWGHLWFRIAFGLWFLISGYDTFSGAISQVLPKWELIPLGSLVMGGSHLLPWWGWLLILQGMLWASLADYVMRHIPSLRAASARPEMRPSAVPAPSLPEAPTARLMTEPKPAITYPGQGLMTNPSPPPSPIDMAGARRVAQALVSANQKRIIKEWTRPTSMQLFQAACLWAEELPPANPAFPISESAQASLEMLKGATISGEIPSTEVTKYYETLPIDERARVTRKGLFDFAVARKEYPVFLFPDGPATGLV